MQMDDPKPQTLLATNHVGLSNVMAEIMLTLFFFLSVLAIPGFMLSMVIVRSELLSSCTARQISYRQIAMSSNFTDSSISVGREDFITCWLFVVPPPGLDGPMFLRCIAPLITKFAESAIRQSYPPRAIGSVPFCLTLPPPFSEVGPRLF